MGCGGCNWTLLPAVDVSMQPGQPISVIRKIEPGESCLPAFAILAARR